jgi:hypothetical protein
MVWGHWGLTSVSSADPPKKGGELGRSPPAVFTMLTQLFWGDVWAGNLVATYSGSEFLLCLLWQCVERVFEESTISRAPTRILKIGRRCLLYIEELHLMILKLYIMLQIWVRNTFLKHPPQPPPPLQTTYTPEPSSGNIHEAYTYQCKCIEVTLNPWDHLVHAVVATCHKTCHYTMPRPGPRPPGRGRVSSG